MERRYRIERLFRGWTNVSVKASSGYGLINKLRSSGIICRKQFCKGEMLHFSVRRKDVRFLRRLAEENNAELQLHDEFSFPLLMHRYRQRFGIPLGLLLGALLLVYTANVVMVIDIEGNDTVTDQEILAVLEECSVRRGVFIGDVDFYRSELQVRSAFDEIAWVGIRHTGNRLVVEVMETTGKPELIHDRVPCHIVADRTAQITNASVSSGQLTHSAGTAVKEGEIIVSGIWADENGHMTFTHASAEITGIYEEEQTFFCDSVQTVRDFTGAETEQRTLDLFSMRLPLSFGENPYSDYNIRTESTPLTLFGKKLPVSLEKTVYMEYGTEEITLSEEEMRKNLQEQQERYEANFLSECRIIRSKTKYTKKETAMVLTVSYILEGEIGAEKELLIKDNRKPYVASRKKDET